MCVGVIAGERSKMARGPWRSTRMRETMEKNRRHRTGNKLPVAAEDPVGLIPLISVILVTFVSGLIIGALMAIVLMSG